MNPTTVPIWVRPGSPRCTARPGATRWPVPRAGRPTAVAHSARHQPHNQPMT